MAGDEDPNRFYNVILVSAGETFDLDVIWFAGEFWIVPEWITDKLLGRQTPARAIPLAAIGDVYRTDDPEADATFYAKKEVPRSVLFGDIEPATAKRYEVLVAPELVETEGVMKH